MSTQAAPARARRSPPPATIDVEITDDAAAFHLILESTSSQRRLYSLSRSYLGGKKFWHRNLESRSDIHSTILDGVAYGSLNFLLDSVKWLELIDLANVLGRSTRTLRRQSETPDKQMPPDLASKAWMFAETLAKATEVFGGKEEAERWMSKAAMGLDGRRPIDLLQTVQGAELVNDFLTRLEYGVYS